MEFLKLFKIYLPLCAPQTELQRLLKEDKNEFDQKLAKRRRSLKSKRSELPADLGCRWLPRSRCQTPVRLKILPTLLFSPVNKWTLTQSRRLLLNSVQTGRSPSAYAFPRPLTVTSQQNGTILLHLLAPTKFCCIC